MSTGTNWTNRTHRPARDRDDLHESTSEDVWAERPRAQDLPFSGWFSWLRISNQLSWSLTVSPTPTLSSLYTTTFTHQTYTHHRHPHNPHYEYWHDNIRRPIHRYWRRLHIIPSMNQFRPKSQWKFRWVRRDSSVHHTSRKENTKYLDTDIFQPWAMTFAEVLTWLKTHNLADLSRAVALLRVQDAQDLTELTPQLLQEHGWPPRDILRLRQATHPHEALPSNASAIVPRRDITPVNQAKRGNLKMAILASYDTNRKRTQQELTDQFYSASTQDPRGSQWKTWCTMAHAWGLLPIPITDELVLAIGASMKHGRYRSSKNYFLRAQQEHRDNINEPLSDKTLALITRVIRSINRGIGPTPLKDSFEVELFHTPLPIDEADPGVWYLHTDAARDITAICCWWLLRGIEAAAAKMHHVWRQHTALATTTFFTLPIQKNDTTGMCVSRGHTIASANDRGRILSALTVPWSGTKRGSEPCSQGTTQYHSFQNQKAHTRPNRRSFRYSAEPYNPQEQHFSDQDHKENKYRDSRSTSAESPVLNSSLVSDTASTQYNSSDDGDQMPSRGTSKTHHWYDPSNVLNTKPTITSARSSKTRWPGPSTSSG